MTRPMRAIALLILFCSMLPVGAQERPTPPVTDAMLQDPDPADWLMWRRTLDHWGHSPLDQVNAGNVDDLELVWSRPLHSGVQEGTPLVYDGVMFFPNPSDVIQAMDAATGELLWATPTVVQTVVENIDGATGAVQVAEDMLFTGAEQTRFVCPTPYGGKNWPAGAYSPTTNAMYMPLQNTCMTIRSTAEEPSLDDLYAIDIAPEITPGVESVGTVRALDQMTGEVLWEANLGSQVTGYPATYAVDGKQYIAVSTGGSLTLMGLNRLVSEDLRAGTDTNLFVFALPD